MKVIGLLFVALITVTVTTSSFGWNIKKQDGVWITIKCNDGEDRTVRQCRNGKYEAGGSGLGGCHYKFEKAAEKVCAYNGG